MTGDAIAGRLRRWLLLLAAGAFLTTLGELWMENHAQQPLQFIPWILCLGGLLALVPALARPGKATLTALRLVMIIVGLGGVGGIAVHLLENLSFQRDVHPTAAMLDTVIGTLKGAAPLLAPGALTFAALLALAATYYHPALFQDSAPR